MNKLQISLYFLLFILFSVSCNISDNPYTYIREYDNGTYRNNKGVVKYISGYKDTALVVADVYAEILQKIKYIDVADAVPYKDSIIRFGHCWSKSPGFKTVMDSMYYDFSNIEGQFYIDTLQIGSEFISTLYLDPETDYYVRAYVITGEIINGVAVAKDTAFIPYELHIRTSDPVDVWENKKEYENFTATRGAISFSYKGKLYAGLGHDETGADRYIYEYSPKDDIWKPVAIHPGFYDGAKFFYPTNSVAFVIENVQLNPGVYKDYVYIGTGYYDDNGTAKYTGKFKRLDLESLQQGGDGLWEDIADYSNFGVENAVAFTLNKIGYVGLGNNGGTIVSTFNKYNTVTGEWKRITNFPNDNNDIGRTKAVSFVIDEYAYLCCGVTEFGEYKNDLWRFGQDASGDGTWVPKRPLPADAREEAVGFSIGKLGYVGTGRNQNGVLLADFWRYNPNLNLWEPRADYGDYVDGVLINTSPRMEAIGCGLNYGYSSENPNSIDYRGYLGLGINPDLGPFDQFLNDFRSYRP